jgi:hypothetical protein
MLLLISIYKDRTSSYHCKNRGVCFIDIICLLYNLKKMILILKEARTI